MEQKKFARIAAVLLFVFSSCLFFSLPAEAAYETGLMAGVLIPNVDVGDYSVPLVYDWNSDGKKDLIVGSRTGTAQTGLHGYVNFYENIGTDSAPLFSSSSQIQSCPSACSAIDAAAAG